MTYAEKQRRKANSEGRCRHNLKLCSQCIVVSDAARRASDTINARIAFHGWSIRNCWMAFRLTDGTTDGNLYDSKAHALKHVTGDYKYWFFVCFRNTLGGSNPRDMQIWINVHRHAYENGLNLNDPDAKDGGPDTIIDTALYDRLNNTHRQSIPTLIPGVSW